jgi:hypothetical protein
MGVKFFAFFTEGVDKPSKQVFTRVFLEAGGREDLFALKISRSEAKKNKSKTKAKRSPQNAKENRETRVVDEEREKSKTIRADKKKHPVKRICTH